MRELAYERGFRRWAEREGVRWERLVYARAEAGGDTVAYRLTPPGEPRALLLAVHGAGNDALFAMVGLFKRCLRLGLQVFSFDVDGHGRHSTTRLDADAVTGTVQAALQHSGAAAAGLPVHALGVSFGGALLLHALPELRPTPASAVLAVAPLRLRVGWGTVLNELRPRILAAAWREREHCGLFGLVPSFGPVKRGTYPLRLAEPAPGAFGYLDRLDQVLRRLRLEQAAARTRTPVLLVYGEQDRVVPPAQGERLAALLPEAELLRVARGTHLTTPLEPDAVRRVQRWLDARSPGRSPALEAR